MPFFKKNNNNKKDIQNGKELEKNKKNVGWKNIKSKRNERRGKRRQNKKIAVDGATFFLKGKEESEIK